MRYLTSTIAAFALATTVGAFAQQQPPPSATPPAPPDAAPPPATEPAPAAKSTVTGCVVQAKTTSGGTVFVLSKASGGSATMYVLEGSTQSDWTTNVNKKVEVTGPVQEVSNPGAAPDPNVVRPPHITAESVKVVAQSCS
jgi:hypothetical protein